MTAARISLFLSACLWTSLSLALTSTIPTEAWIAASPTTARPRLDIQQACAASPTSLFGKKKKKGGSGGGSATKGAAKMQVKLLEHIAGTGQAGDVIMVNPVFFANKLRPQKLARVITDEEVKADLEKKQSQSEELLKQAKAVQDLLDEDDKSTSSYVLTFSDNQTGPDGKKIFGGIGPKKILESLRKDCKEFDAYSKEFTKQVSILDVEEQEIVVEDASSSEKENSKYKDYSSHSDNSEDATKSIVKYSSLPKKDKLTIKQTGIFRVKVALTKDLFAKVKVVVE